MKRTQIEEVVAGISGKLSLHEKELLEKQLLNVNTYCLDVLRKIMR